MAGGMRVAPWIGDLHIIDALTFPWRHSCHCRGDTRTYLSCLFALESFLSLLRNVAHACGWCEWPEYSLATAAMTRVMAATAFSTIWKPPQRNTRYEGISRSRAIAVACSKRFHWMGCSLRVWLDAKVVTVIRTMEGAMGIHNHNPS